jgi:hypothetical protein
LDDVRGYILRLAGLTFITQWLWEMLQMPAYAEMADQSWAKSARDCTLAAFGDVLISAFIYALVALKHRNWRWGLTPAGMDYALAALVSGGMAIIVERLAIGQGRWSYTNAMPRLPNTEVGLLPFLQLSVLVPLSLAISHQWWKHSRRSENSRRPSASGRL